MTADEVTFTLTLSQEEWWTIQDCLSWSGNYWDDPDTLALSDKVKAIVGRRPLARLPRSEE